MVRRRATLPTLPPQVEAGPAQPVALTLADRRYRAQARAWALMGTSIPTRDILASYLSDVTAET